MHHSKLKRNTFVNQLHLALDVIIVAISFVLAHNFKNWLYPSGYSDRYVESFYYILLLQIIVTQLIAEKILNQHESFTRKKYYVILFDNLKMLVAVIILLILTNFILKINISRMLLAFFFGVSFALLFVSKSAVFFLYKNHYRSESNKVNVIIVGTKMRARHVIDHIQNIKKNYKILGCLDTDKGLEGELVANGVKVIGSIDDLQRLVLSNIVDEVIFAMPLKHIDSIDTHILFIETIGIQVRIFPDWYIHSTVFQPGISKISFDDFRGSPTIVLTATNQNYLALLVKALIDLFVSLFMLILLSPLLIFIALLIKSVSKGPSFFKQDRMGLNGRKFTLYKFRTMVVDAEARLKELQKLNESDGPAFKITNDPRIIPVIGKFLRKTSLDELPQLLNILRGNMSLVGPRPPLQSEVENYDVWQRRRVSMKPGLTCLWQIKPNRNDLSFNEWMALDLEYIDNWSLTLDFSILLQTALVVFGAQGR